MILLITQEIEIILNINIAWRKAIIDSLVIPRLTVIGTEEFKEESFAGLFYKTRQPQSAGVTGSYTHFHKSASEGFFTDIDLPCVDQTGEPIKAKDSDWFGDRKTNEVCVKEMARVYDNKDKTWVELINPIYPDGLLGDFENNRKYSLNPTNFPNVKRPVLSKKDLIANINEGFDSYAREKVKVNSCNKMKRVSDAVSDNELMMLIKNGVNSKLTSHELERAKVQAREIYGDNWRHEMASQLTKQYVYEAFTGSYQNQYIRDGFHWGSSPSIFGVLTSFLLNVVTFGGVNLFKINGAREISAKVASIVYEFIPFKIKPQDERFNEWGNLCLSDRCHYRKYLNSVSNESATEVTSYTFILDGLFYLESYAKAKQLFHEEAAICLNNLAKNYSESFGVKDINLEVKTGEVISKKSESFNECTQV